ncbi:hypothetical protein ACK3Y5_19870, partial [Aeromonas caviae]
EPASRKRITPFPPSCVRQALAGERLPSTSQKAPINSAAKGFTLVSPMMINTRARKAHTDTVIEQAPYYGSVAEQDETDPAHRGYVMNVTSY